MIKKKWTEVHLNLILINLALVKSQIPIKTDEDGQFKKSGFYWSNPPADTYYDFYIFDYQNDDEVIFFEKQPRVNEKGPYRWKFVFSSFQNLQTNF